MEESILEDTSLQTKRKFESTDVDDNGSIVKRSKASGQQIQSFSIQIDGYSEHNLLDFSDDVLLHILDYCSSLELKALSFCCRRLARLCTDRSLWRVVDLRQQASGVRALTFYSHCLKSTTTNLYIRGLLGSGSAKKIVPKNSKGLPFEPLDCDCINPMYPGRKFYDGCLNKSGNTRAKVVIAKSNKKDLNEQGPSSIKSETSKCNLNENDDSTKNDLKTDDNKNSMSDLKFEASNQPGTSAFSSHRPPKECGNTSPKPFSSSYEGYTLHTSKLSDLKSEYKKKEPQNEDTSEKKVIADCCKRENICLATITKELVFYIRQKCINLREIRLEFCNLSCNPFLLSELPRSLEVLSLKGCKRSNIPFHKPFFFKIQDYLCKLEELDLSFCRWLSGHSLLLLSKMQQLKKLWLRGCTGLGECVAYASLSTRFGFKSLELLDVRETAMGDSEVSSFSFLMNLRELYLEPPLTDIGVDPPIDWPEHSGLMDPWECDYPCNEVDEYIEMMNKDESPCSNSESGIYGSLNSSDIFSDQREKKSSNATNANISNHGNENDDDNMNHPENIGLFYRSVVNVSYEERNPLNGDNQNLNEERMNNDPLPVADRQQPAPENGVENGMGVQVGPLGVQVGPLGVQVDHAGVHVGPVRLQMRPVPRVDRAQPENGAQQGLGPVEVQVGPDGVQVGLGGVRVDPVCVRAGPEGGVQVELGGVRVDPRWMQIAPGVHVGFEGVEVGPVEVQVGPERRQGPAERREPPVGLRVGPIEVQVGAVRLEVGRDGRHIDRPGQRNEGRIVNPENMPNIPLRRREEQQVDPDRQANEAVDAQDAYINGAQLRDRQPADLPGVQIDPIWVNENVDPERRLQIGFNVHLRAGHVNPRRAQQNNDRLQGPDAPQVGANNRNLNINGAVPNNGNPQRDREDNRQLMEYIQMGGEEGQGNIREQIGHRGVVIFPERVRFGNFNMRQEPVEGQCRRAGLMNGVRDANLDAQRENLEERNVQDIERLVLQRALRRAFEIFDHPPLPEGGRQREQRRQNEQAGPEAQPRQNQQLHVRFQQNEVQGNRPAGFNDGPEREGLARPNGRGSLGERGPARPDEQPQLDERARPEGQGRPDGRGRPDERQDGQHNIMDGRVHVIYVNPQYPRRPAAEVLVAAGMPRNAGLMMFEGGNLWRAREDFHLRDLQHVLDLQIPLWNPVAHLQHLGGGDLVTDASLLHFGDSEQLVHVGGPHLFRNRYSTLEVLICRGYRGVTDQSLAHLTTAAPALRYLDIVGCGVTNAGVTAFAMHRPDCKLDFNTNESSDRPAGGPQ